VGSVVRKIMVHAGLDTNSKILFEKWLKQKSTAQVVEHLPGKFKSLVLNSRDAKTLFKKGKKSI
jgi:hypothetical protein